MHEWGQASLHSITNAIFRATMSRPLRIRFPDALYHVTARGDRREAIVEDDNDRQMFLSILAQVVGEFNWTCYA
jgi:putative transposase